MISELIRLLAVTVPLGESMLCTIGSTSAAQWYLILITATSAATDRLHQLAITRLNPKHSRMASVYLFGFLDKNIAAIGN
jgi:hypothetical protein